MLPPLRLASGTLLGIDQPIWALVGVGLLALLGALGLMVVLRRLARGVRSEANVLHKKIDDAAIALRESEERFDLAIRGTDAGIWDWDLRTNHVVYSPRWKGMLGHAEDEIGDDYLEWERRLHPEDRQRALDTIRDYLDGKTPYYRLEHRLRHRDGSYRWIISRGAAVRDPHGKPYRFVGSHIDITPQKTAEERVLREQRLLRQLLSFHEHDRRLIAFEIHDGFVQQTTAALLHLQALRDPQDRGSEEIRNTLDTAKGLLQQSIDEARRLIGGLRPAVLEESGIIAALNDLIREVEQRGNLHVEFSHAVKFDRLAPLLETSIFRIAQEALTNASRHSRSDNARVTLLQIGDRVRLEVQDWGIGFDAEKVDKDRFGLQGIRDRARLLEGQATIEAAPGQGTRVIVELPAAEKFPDESRSGPQ